MTQLLLPPCPKMHLLQVIASCGKDNMVRLWSCVTPSCRVAMRYEEEPIAVAIFQYLLIVAFQHRIMCYCLLAHTYGHLFFLQICFLPLLNIHSMVVFSTYFFTVYFLNCVIFSHQDKVIPPITFASDKNV
uniref:Uncharacterized protein n=1 Tax=Physcomitrium patens TaxID=3218 RepID=A0A2K1J254_PHYPA|nr:hypothetical protein PHYPA_021475 [Physcomitrium patens]